jgi:hypothetical protein
VALYAYPGLKKICQLLPEPTTGPGFFLFSPEDRFLVIKFATWLPATDENYPYPGGNLTDIGIIETQLFDVQKCQEIKEFPKFNGGTIKFSPDSSFLYLMNAYLKTERGFIRGSWQLDLTTYKLQKLAE